MERFTPGLMLRFIEHEIEANFGAAIAHRNVCRRILKEVRLEEQRFRHGKFQEFISMFVSLVESDIIENQFDMKDRINLVKFNEDIMVKWIRLTTVEQVYLRLAEKDARKSLKKRINGQIKSVHLSELKTSAYNVIPIMTSEWRINEPRLYVSIGYDRIRIRLESIGGGNPRIYTEFQPFQETGCRITYYITEGLPEVVVGGRRTEDINGIEYSDMAANEFIELIKKFMPYSGDSFDILEILDFNVDPWQREISLKNLKFNFSHKIANWMKAQESCSLVCARHFSLRVCRPEIDTKPPFSLKFLRPANLKQLTVRSWDNRNLGNLPFPSFPMYMTDWDDTEQWKKIQVLDMNDRLFRDYYPKLFKCHTAHIFQLDLFGLRYYLRQFYEHRGNGTVYTRCPYGEISFLTLELTFTPDSEVFVFSRDDLFLEMPILFHPNFHVDNENVFAARGLVELNVQ